MKKALLITAATVVAIATPTSIYAIKRLDTSSTAPTIVSSDEGWSKTVTVRADIDATFGGSDLDYYEYCISDTDSVDDCEWKTSSVNTVRVRNSGTSYVWFRGVSKYGVIGRISNYVITRIDRAKPEASAEITTTSSSITIVVAATDNSGIKSFEYSIDGSEFVADSESHTFDGLDAGTSYNIKIKITDLAGNTKYLSYSATTTSLIFGEKVDKSTSKSGRSVQNVQVSKVTGRKKPEKNKQNQKDEAENVEGGSENIVDVSEDEEQMDILVIDELADGSSSDGDENIEVAVCGDDGDDANETTFWGDSEDDEDAENSDGQEMAEDVLECVEVDDAEDGDGNGDDALDECDTPEQSEEDDAFVEDNVEAELELTKNRLSATVAE